MRILLLTYSLGGTASGKVTSRIVQALFDKGVEIIVITAQNKVGQTPYKVYELKTFFTDDSIWHRIYTHFITPLFLRNRYANFWWSKRACKVAEKLIKQWSPDWLYTRSSPFEPLVVGSSLKAKTGVRLISHFTDPYPAPRGFDFLPELREYRIREACEVLENSDLISFGNQKMLDYEFEITKFDAKEKAFVSHDSVSSDKLEILPLHIRPNDIRLVYLGNIYGSRNPKPLVEAISRLRKKGENIHLDIYCDRVKYKLEYEFVHYYDKLDIITPALSSADILVDIDGDDDAPVFVSSKLKDYLACNRPILSITPANSPSSDLLQGLSTVKCVRNKEIFIEKALSDLITTKFSDETYTERCSLISAFSPNNISLTLLSKLKGFE